MILRSEWRTLPGEPTSPLGWWLRELRRPLRITLAIAAATLLIFFAAWHFHYEAAAIFVLPPVVWLTFYTAIWRSRAKALPRLAALAPSPAPAECFPVEMAFSQNGVCTGRDQGLASFVDGWLHVEGLHASLSLRPVDITKPKPLPDRDTIGLPGGQEVELISLGRTQEDRDTFRETLRVWYRFPFGLPAGQPLLPPAAVHPSAVVRPLNVLFVHLAFAFPVVAGFLFFAGWPQTAQVLPFLLPGVVFAFRNAAKAFGDLRRIKNLHRQVLDESEIARAIKERALDAG